jgi:protein-disulfide isomerase
VLAIPIENHPHAFDAALAAECAAAQNRFESFHDVLYAEQDSIGRKSWDDFASVTNIPDRAQFRDCVASEEHRKRVQQDFAEGQRVGVLGTPSFVFNGRLVSGMSGVEQIEEWVSKALKSH